MADLADYNWSDRLSNKLPARGVLN